MLKFFRKIRRKLLDENQLKKYAVYACGEIILVAIGILLALQVNNWNESRKNTQLQVLYLENIKAELEKNQMLMERLVINRFERKMEGLQKAKMYAANNYQVSDTMAFLSDVAYGAVYANGIEFLNSGVFEELKNTGNIQLISNDSLKTAISAYYYFVDNQLINVRYYISDYQPYINGFRVFDRENPDSTSPDDQTFMLTKLRSEETLIHVNREINYGNQVYFLINGINKRTKDLIDWIERELKA